MKFLSGLKVRKLSKSIEKNPNQFTNYKELISLYIAEKRFDEAMSVIDKALKNTWSKNEKTWLDNQHLVIRSATGESTEKLIEDAFKLLNDISLNASTRMDTALTVLPLLKSETEQIADTDKREYLSVLEDIANEMPKHSGSIQIYKLLADIAFDSGQYSNAFKSIEKAIESAQQLRNPGFGRLCLDAARMATKTTKTSKNVKTWLINALDSDTLSDTETAEALAALAELNRSDDDLLGAMEKYETALRFTGDQKNCQTARMRYQLAQINFALERYSEAEKEAVTALNINCFEGDELVDLLLWLSKLKELRGNKSEAFRYLDTALESADNPSAKIRVLKQKAALQKRNESYQDAVSDIELALSYTGDSPDAELLLELAHLNNLEGAYHKSLKILKQLTQDSDAEKSVGKSRILLETAIAWLGRLKVVRALETFIKVIENASEVEPEWQQAKRHLITLKKDLKRPDGVKKYQIDGTERKTLESLLAKIPDDDDLLARLRSGLKKTRSGLIVGIEKILGSRSVIDESVLDEIEELMILSDLGVETTTIIIDGLRDKLVKHELNDADVVRNFIRSEIERILSGRSSVLTLEPDVKPYVLMVVGVNGVGKTTTIAKIAKRFIDQGNSVLLAAADTFRAGAIEQLKEWGRRLDVDVIAHREGADPSAVAWDAVAAAKNRNMDVLIVDTAGRLHTKSNLMEELKKVQRVIDKNMTGAPHEVLLVLDATTGQNAIIQARQFCQTVNVSGIALTKLDGTAKGGIIVSIVQELKTPVKLIGIGERMDDLRDFEPSVFANALFESYSTDDPDSQT